MEHPNLEPEIIINPDTREIYIPNKLRNIGVVSDDNAEVVKIRIPRYFDGNDFSLRTCTISFNNALNERGVYTVKNITVEENSLSLYWHISKFVTKRAGIAKFVVEFKKEFDDRGMSYSWSTLPAELNIMPGLDTDIVVDEKDLSLYQTLLSHIQANDLRVANLMTKLEDLYEIKISIELLNSQLSDLRASFDASEISSAFWEKPESIIEEE